jgi:hypothetical protein
MIAPNCDSAIHGKFVKIPNTSSAEVDAKLPSMAVAPCSQVGTAAHAVAANAAGTADRYIASDNAVGSRLGRAGCASQERFKKGSAQAIAAVSARPAIATGRQVPHEVAGSK